jgi:probable HAF family extracellular repeat protein
VSIYNYITLDDPLGTNGTIAQGINASGQIVGYYIDSSNHTHGFHYSGGTYTTLDDPLSPGGTYLTGINASGQIVGYTNPWQGFLYSNGNFTTVSGTPNAINNNGQIVGTRLIVGSGTSGFVYSNGSYTTLNVGGTGTQALGINDNGQIVGYSYFMVGLWSPTNPPFGAPLPAYYRGPFGVTSFGITYSQGPDSYGPAPYGINNQGDIVGQYYSADGSVHGFLSNNQTYITLDDPLATQGTIAQGINDAGQIVGTYSDNTSQHGFLLVIIPNTPPPGGTTADMRAGFEDLHRAISGASA